METTVSKYVPKFLRSLHLGKLQFGSKILYFFYAQGESLMYYVEEEVLAASMHE